MMQDALCVFKWTLFGGFLGSLAGAGVGCAAGGTYGTLFAPSVGTLGGCAAGAYEGALLGGVAGLLGGTIYGTIACALPGSEWMPMTLPRSKAADLLASLLTALTLLSAGGLALLGCQEKPADRAELIGVWVASSSSLDMMSPAFREESPHPSLELDTNGKFVAAGVPRRLVSWKREWKDGSVSGTGTWRLVEVDHLQAVDLRFLRMNGVATDTTAQLYVHGGREPLLYFYLQDIDDGLGFEFGKEISSDR